MRIYLASSWRNCEQPAVLHALRLAGFEVYDFRNPEPGNTGFKWSAIDPEWQQWTPERFQGALSHPIAEAGFGLDWSAMQRADVGFLLLPSGRSAHLEAGYFVGANKPLIVLLRPGGEPELMYKMASLVTFDLCDAVAYLEQLLKEAA
jgi:hypothetical protein